MDIAGLGGTWSATSPYQVQGTQATLTAPGSGSPAVDADDSATSGSGAAATVQISPRAQLFSKLQSLARSDPDKFKQVMSDAANQLKSDAQQTGSTQAAQALNALADKFAQAAQTGDASALTPSQGSQGHHHHHHHGDGASSVGASAAQAAYAPTGSSSGASSQPDDTMRQALSSVFSELNAAVSN